VKNAVRSSMYLFVVILIWFLISAMIDSEWVLPDPWTVFLRLGSILGDSSALLAIAATLLRLLASTTISFVIGGALGLWAGLKPKIAFLTQPIATVFRTIPVVSIIVIVLILFGFRAAPYVITFLMLMPISYQAAREGIASIDPELIDVYRLEDNHPIRMAWNCYLPLISGYLRTAALQSAGLGIKVLVMAEYLAQTPNSVGAYLHLARTNIDIAAVFAWTILLIAASLYFEDWIRRSQRWMEPPKASSQAKSPLE
jgi:NitT/TauT family transport system permease protein